MKGREKRKTIPDAKVGEQKRHTERKTRSIRKRKGKKTRILA